MCKIRTKSRMGLISQLTVQLGTVCVRWGLSEKEVTVELEEPMLALIRPSELGTGSELEGLTLALIRPSELGTRSKLEGLTLALIRPSDLSIRSELEGIKMASDQSKWAEAVGKLAK